jgi:ligand-binding sensor domain-containing protein
MSRLWKVASGARLAIVVALVAAASTARAETYAFHAYPPDPLPSPTIRALFEDRDGLLWLGTELGLVRYDGTTFDPFVAGAASRVGPIELIEQDGQGRVWGLGFGGLEVVSGGGARVTRVSEAEGLLGARPSAFVATDDGVIVAAAVPNALSRVRLDARGVLTVERIDLGDPPSVAYRTLARLADGTLLVGTAADGARVVDPSGHVTRHLDGRSVTSLTASVASTGGGVRALIGTNQGLHAYADGAVRAFTTDEALARASVNAVLEARDGTVYFGTTDGVLARCPPGASPSCAVVAGDTSGARVRALAEDGAGVVWGALNAPAVLRYVPGAARATVIDGHRGFPYADVLDVRADRNGLLFVATANGLVRAVGDGIVNLDDGEALAGSTVWSIARLPAPSGALILGTQNGLARVDGDGARAILARDGTALEAAIDVMPEDAKTLLLGTETGMRRVHLEGDRARVERVEGTEGRIESMARAATGEVYVAARRGLAVLHGSRLDPISLPGLEASDAVDNVATGADGRLWIATSRGLFVRAADGAVARIGRAQGLRDDDVDLVFEAADGAVWVAYTKNLGATVLSVPRGAHVDPETVTARHLSSENGLPADSAYAFAEMGGDGVGRGVWVGTSRGLCRIAPDGAMARYGRSSGMSSEDVSYGGILVDDDRSLWVGTTRGVSHIDPARLRPPLPPVAHFSSLRLGGSEKDPRAPARVAYAQRDFAASFTSLLFQSEAETTFRHRLVGYKDEWTPFTRDRAAVFANLPPGDYRFEAEARTDSGAQSVHPASFSFTVITPVYMTAWFRASALALVVALLGAVFRAVVSQLRRRNRELEARVAERTRELEKRVADLRRANDDLFASNKRADRIFSALADALPSTVIDEKYRLDERIGAGGTGVVFRGAHLGLGRAIAVKIFKPMPGNDSASALDRFRLEGRWAARIEHANAVQIFDHGISADGMAYLVMQLRRTLAEEIAEHVEGDRPIAFDRTLDLIDAVASVLETAHQLGIVHRDIKPENVFLHRGAEGEVIKVVDFGIAKVMDAAREGASGITMEGSMLGTPAYMAPECFEGDSSLVGPPSDVYALGVLAFQLLTARLPFRGSFTEVATAHVAHAPPAPSTLRRGVTPATDAAMARALAKDPADRPRPEHFAEELRRSFGRRRSSAAPPIAPLPGEAGGAPAS